MKTVDELIQKYKSRNLMEELSWAANYTRKGYMSAEYEDYYSWLALAAYRKIKELEQENSMLKSKAGKRKSDASWDEDIRLGQVQGMW